MVMKTAPLEQAIQAAKASVAPGATVIYLSPQGRPLDQEGLLELAQRPSLVLLAGRYEGVDERLIEAEVDEEWSIGDYVLSGGELAAMVMIDGLSRLLPGVLGHHLSAEQDSFAEGLLDCPHYTRPEHYRGRAVPDVLLSGNHEVIRRWRLKQSLGRTWLRRRDLLQKVELSDEQNTLLAEFIREHND
jgi:tRNA (guanine37-N1)-methyltransferase